MTATIKYPRRVLIRSLLRGAGRVLLPVLTNLKMTGRQNFPETGPLIIVGNHTASMEAVLMAVYPRRQVEFMGATDLPFQGLAKPMAAMYGHIPIFRGNVSRTSMRQALDVLGQGGTIGLFPEGGYWEPVVNQAQSGVAWLSHKAQAPVLPIGFGDTRGKIPEIFGFKRPELVMNVGAVLPPVQLDPDNKRKQALQDAAKDIMHAVWGLVPEEVLEKRSIVENEVFELQVQVSDSSGNEVRIPPELEISQGKWFSRYLHRKNMVDLMRDQLHLPVQPLKELHKGASLGLIIPACQSVIDYIRQDNPYFFSYRYGQKGGTEMLESFYQMQSLAKWAMEQGYSMVARPLHHYTDPETKERKTQIEPVEFLL